MLKGLPNLSEESLITLERSLSKRSSETKAEASFSSAKTNESCSFILHKLSKTCLYLLRKRSPFSVNDIFKRVLFNPVLLGIPISRDLPSSKESMSFVYNPRICFGGNPVMYNSTKAKMRRFWTYVCFFRKDNLTPQRDHHLIQ